MIVLFILPGIISGAVLALILNTLLANKIEEKAHRIGLKVTAYAVCIVLGIGFAVLGSLQMIMDTFITNRIAFIELKLAEVSGLDIQETGIEAEELALLNEKLQQLTGDMDIRNDGFMENLIYGIFLKKLTGYINSVENGISTLEMAADENGLVTIKSVLYNLKDTAIGAVSPWFLAGQIGIVVLLILFIIIYVCIVFFLKKGGGAYNKSIVFGDSNHDTGERPANKE